jgi:hypothetical protein
MLVTFNRRNNNTGERILDFLKTIEANGRQIIKKGIAVIKFRGDQGISKNYC